MNAWKIAVGVAFALSLQGTSALAEGSARARARAQALPRSPRADVGPKKAELKAQKPAGRTRKPSRDQSTDLELPQLG